MFKACEIAFHTPYLYKMLLICLRCHRHLDGLHLYSIYFSKVSRKGTDFILGPVEYDADYRYAVFPAGNAQAGDDHGGMLMKLFVHNGDRFLVTYDAADNS